MNNRRDFLRKSTLAASVLLFSPRFVWADNKKPAFTKASKPIFLDSLKLAESKENMVFSRGSAATYYNEKGLLAYSGQNMLTYSEDLKNASWVVTGSTLTVSSDIPAPNGSFTAGILAEEKLYSEHRISRKLIVTKGAVYTFSIYIKAGTCNAVRVSFLISKSYKGGTPKLVLNLTDGTISARSSNVINAKATDAGNGWWRVAVAGKPDLQAVSGFQLFMVGADNTTKYKGKGRTICVWGGQFESGQEVSSYTPTTDQPGSVIRYNYDPESMNLKGFLVEAEATNYLTYSENLLNTDAWQAVSAQVSSNQVLAPDGFSKSFKIVEEASLNLHYIRPVNSQRTVINQVYNFSAFVKPGERKWVYFSADDASIHFDLVERSVSRSDNPLFINTSAEYLGNGWVRCSASIIAAVDQITFGIGVETGENERNYTGDGYSGIYVWGVQLETGLYASSYIPTMSAAAVRSNEMCSLIPPEALTPYDVFIQRTQGGSWADDISGSYKIPYSRYEVEGAGFWDPDTSDLQKEQIAEELYPTEFLDAGLSQVKVIVFDNDYRIQSADQAWSVNHAMNKTCQPFRFQVRSGDQRESEEGKDKERSELYMLNELPFDQDVWLSYAVMVEKGDAVTSEFCHIGQFHATEDAGDVPSVPILTFRFNGEDDLSVTTVANTQGTSEYNTTGEVRYEGKLSRGIWVRNVLRIRFSSTNGQLQWWENGIEKLNLAATGIGNNDAIGPYWKFGVYRTQSPETLTVQYANMELSLESLQSRVHNPLLII